MGTSQIDNRWVALVEDMTEMPDVTVGKMFGCVGLRIGRKFFAILWEDKLVVKVPKRRLGSVLKAGGEPFMPMPGRVMGEWIVLGEKADWFALSSASKDYVSELAAG